MVDLNEIKLGRNARERLRTVGYRTLEKLSRANPVSLRRKTWLSEKQIISIIVSAKERLVELVFEKERSKKEKKKKVKQKPVTKRKYKKRKKVARRKRKKSKRKLSK